MKYRYDIYSGTTKIKTKAIGALSVLILGITSLALPLTFSNVAGAAKPSVPPSDLATAANGTYSVPGNAKLKMRVFVHGSNKNKPLAITSLSLSCNLSDPDSTVPDGVTGWYLPTGNWTYRLNTGSAPSLIGGANLATLASNSFNTWSTPDVSSKVNFVKGLNTSTNRARYDGQNIISWGRTSGSALAVTYTWYYTASGQVAETDTIFNNKFAWQWSSQTNCAYQGYYDAQNILTHELGHWVGLNDNYTTGYANNTMFGYGSPTEVKKNSLATGDTSTVNSLY